MRGFPMILSLLLPVICWGQIKSPDMEHSVVQQHRVLYNPSNLSEESLSWRFTVQLHGCTGVIIDQDKILTAQHCVDRFKNLFYIRFFNGSETLKGNIHGVQSWQNGSEDGSAYMIFEHPRYDVAMILLHPGIQFPTDQYYPISMIDDWRDLTGDLFVAGTGQNNIDQEFYMGFLKGYMINKIDGFHQMRFYKKKSGICGGDSGSPVFTETQYGRYALAGIMAQSSDDLGSKSCGTVAHFVGIDHIYEWLLKLGVYRSVSEAVL